MGPPRSLLAGRNQHQQWSKQQGYLIGLCSSLAALALHAVRSCLQPTLKPYYIIRMFCAIEGKIKPACNFMSLQIDIV